MRKIRLTVIKTFHIEFPDDYSEDDIRDSIDDMANSVVIEDDAGMPIVYSHLVSSEYTEITE